MPQTSKPQDADAVSRPIGESSLSAVCSTMQRRLVASSIFPMRKKQFLRAISFRFNVLTF